MLPFLPFVQGRSIQRSSEQLFYSSPKFFSFNVPNQIWYRPLEKDKVLNIESRHCATRISGTEIRYDQ